MNRRTALTGLALSGLFALPLLRALAGSSPLEAQRDEFFVFIHAQGGWDVTLWADPRNERRGIVDPATTANTDVSGLRLWKDAPFEGETRTFEVLKPAGCNVALGPAIGKMLDHVDRMCIVNGLAMNTVSHPDGVAFSSTGRHLAGGRVVAPSLDTMVANELGLGQTLPVVAIGFPSSFVGETLDRRAVPLRMADLGAIGRVLARSEAWETKGDRDAVSALLGKEAADLAEKTPSGDALRGMALQYESLRKMVSAGVADALSPAALRAAYPAFDVRSRLGVRGLASAFAVEAMRRDLVRCVSYALGSFDTHVGNYRLQAITLQDLFDNVAELLRALDATPHPTRAGKKLADHTHVVVFSEFCRTPQINFQGGRDHYPNNSALVLSPRFKKNLAFGKTDREQLLPDVAKSFASGPRPIAPPDLLATLLAAFGIDPARYVREGEVVHELLA